MIQPLFKQPSSAKETMKVPGLIAFISAAFLMIASMCVASPRLARAQESDLWESEGSTASDITSDSDVTPDTKAPLITVSGQWAGTIDDNLRGSGAITADFNQKKAKLAGTWTAFGDIGTLLGTVTSDSSKITFTFVPKKPYIHCRFTLKSTSASDSAIVGTYKFAACGPLTKEETGTINISPAPPPDAGQQ
jgi:hypothetical protein